MSCYGHHHHHHDAVRRSNQWRLVATLGLSVVYLFAELIGGLLSNSLALLADAGHMLSDVAALGLSLFALWIARRPPTPKRTFGYYRAEILAALINGATLVAISIFIFIEAWRRMWQPPQVAGPLMMAIALGGLAVNLAGMWLLGHARGDNLNMRGAWLHMLTDALGTLGAIVAGMLIWALGWNWADPVASVLIGLLVIYSSWQLMAEAVAVLMETAPRGIDVDAVRGAIMEVPGVSDTHDLHVWTITSGLHSLSAHVVLEDVQSHVDLLTGLRNMLHERFHIEHITIQIEPANFEERPTAI